MSKTLEGLQWEHGYHALENAADRIDALEQKINKAYEMAEQVGIEINPGMCTGNYSLEYIFDGEVRSFIRHRNQLIQENENLIQKNKTLLSALMSMSYQYLAYSARKGNNVLFTHDFMSAGEETLALLVELGIMEEIKPSYFKLVKEIEEK
jgi:hypothetical protein